MQFGGKYETKYDRNPGPGEYDIESGMRSIKPRSPVARMIAERADHMFIEEVPQICPKYYTSFSYNIGPRADDSMINTSMPTISSPPATSKSTRRPQSASKAQTFKPKKLSAQVTPNATSAKKASINSTATKTTTDASSR